MTNKKLTMRRPGETVFALMLVVLSLVAVQQSVTVSPLVSISSPGVLPLLASLVMLFSSLVYGATVCAMAPPKAGENFHTALTPTVLLMFSGLCGMYIGLLYILGFLPSTLIFLITSIVYLHRNGWLLAFFVSMNALAVIYMVFRVSFKIILPQGILTL